jgi:hypothetical protein
VEIGAEILVPISREFGKSVEWLLRYLSAALFFCPRLLAESLPFTPFRRRFSNSRWVLWLRNFHFKPPSHFWHQLPSETLDLCTPRGCDVVIVVSKLCLPLRFYSRDSRIPAGLLF